MPAPMAPEETIATWYPERWRVATCATSARMRAMSGFPVFWAMTRVPTFTTMRRDSGRNRLYLESMSMLSHLDEYREEDRDEYRLDDDEAHQHLRV